ncbi:MAG: FAM72 protein-domain-containing protein [Benjaminiella poitrasii]|nr:MAG: FAM72 protein-domain-containing protein [Benjaminiella poitrasii]
MLQQSITESMCVELNATLLSDRSVELYSTDLFPSTIGFVNGDYSAAFCSCRVRDIACTNCGNIVGYHVNVPCKSCLGQPNNGHFWMFRNEDIKAQTIFLRFGQEGEELPLLWGFVREAGNFSTGFFRSGDDEAARLSSQLSVHLASSIHLIVHKPYDRKLYAMAYSDNDVNEEMFQFAR